MKCVLSSPKLLLVGFGLNGLRSETLGIDIVGSSALLVAGVANDGQDNFVLLARVRENPFEAV